MAGDAPVRLVRGGRGGGSSQEFGDEWQSTGDGVGAWDDWYVVTMGCRRDSIGDCAELVDMKAVQKRRQSPRTGTLVMQKVDKAREKVPRIEGGFEGAKRRINGVYRAAG